MKKILESLKSIQRQQESSERRIEQVHQEQAVLLAAMTALRTQNVTSSRFESDMPDDFAKRYQIGSLPLKSLDEFLDFDEKMHNDEAMSEDFVSKNKNPTILKNMKFLINN